MLLQANLRDADSADVDMKRMREHSDADTSEVCATIWPTASVSKEPGDQLGMPCALQPACGWCKRMGPDGRKHRAVVCGGWCGRGVMGQTGLQRMPAGVVTAALVCERCPCPGFCRPAHVLRISLSARGRARAQETGEAGAAVEPGMSDAEEENGAAAALRQGSMAERARYIPLRLSQEERRLLRLLEAALSVSEYTDKARPRSRRAPASRAGMMQRACNPAPAHMPGMAPCANLHIMQDQQATPSHCICAPGKLRVAGLRHHRRAGLRQAHRDGLPMLCQPLRSRAVSVVVGMSRASCSAWPSDRSLAGAAAGGHLYLEEQGTARARADKGPVRHPVRAGGRAGLPPRAGAGAAPLVQGQRRLLPGAPASDLPCARRCARALGNVRASERLEQEGIGSSAWPG